MRTVLFQKRFAWSGSTIEATARDTRDVLGTIGPARNVPLQPAGDWQVFREYPFQLSGQTGRILCAWEKGALRQRQGLLLETAGQQEAILQFSPPYRRTLFWSGLQMDVPDLSRAAILRAGCAIRHENRTLATLRCPQWIFQSTLQTTCEDAIPLPVLAFVAACFFLCR